MLFCAYTTSGLVIGLGRLSKYDNNDLLNCNCNCRHGLSLKMIQNSRMCSDKARTEQLIPTALAQAVLKQLN